MAHRIILRGCTPEPMAAYLKALAVLRLVSEQVDPQARAWWRGDVFWLESSLDEDLLVQFFLDRFSPTPIVGPWNGGSGFYEGDRRDGLEAILGSAAERFHEYRETIRMIESLPEMPQKGLRVEELLQRVESAAEKSTGKKRGALIKLLDGARNALPADAQEIMRSSVEDLKGKGTAKLVAALKKLRTEVNRRSRASGKGGIVQACRSRLCDRAVDWMDAAVIFGLDSEPHYPPVLGTGGNEGRLDYTNAFMDRVAELLLRPRTKISEGLLRNALFGEATSNLEVNSVGQYDPGRAGGYNQGPEVETKEIPVNPWNFVLTMEGAVAWCSGVARRQGISAAQRTSSPFTVRSRAVG